MKQYPRLVIRILASGVVVAVIILVIAAGYCLWRGAFTAKSVADAAINLSLVAVAIGALMTIGGGAFAGNANYQMARSAGETSTAGRTQQDVQASEGRLSWTLLLFVGGVEAAIVGFVLRSLFVS